MSTDSDRNPLVDQKTLYESIFGGEGYSLGGPIFYLITGIICLIITLLIILTGIYVPDVVGDVQSIRPNIKFPFYGLCLLLAGGGAIIGIFLGISGILWRNWRVN
jgi:hypothetical protein